VGSWNISRSTVVFYTAEKIGFRGVYFDLYSKRTPFVLHPTNGTHAESALRA
jgi:hypothetical protein